MIETHPLCEFKHLQVQRVSFQLSLNAGERVAGSECLYKWAGDGQAGHFDHALAELLARADGDHSVEIQPIFGQSTGLKSIPLFYLFSLGVE